MLRPLRKKTALQEMMMANWEEEKVYWPLWKLLFFHGPGSKSKGIHRKPASV